MLGGTLFADGVVEKDGQRVLSGHVFWENSAPKKSDPFFACADSATLSSDSATLVLTGRPVIEFAKLRDTGTSEATQVTLTQNEGGLDFKRQGRGVIELIKR